MEAHSLEQEGKVPVISTDRYTLYLEQFDGFTFIHCDVYKWNKSTKKELHKALDYIVKTYGTVCALHDIDDNKHRKFLKMYKFKFYHNIDCLDGECRQVWIKESK